jgi:hypothetical protein
MATLRITSASVRGAVNCPLSVVSAGTVKNTAGSSVRVLKPWASSAPILSNETGKRWKSTHAIGVENGGKILNFSNVAEEEIAKLFPTERREFNILRMHL